MSHFAEEETEVQSVNGVTHQGRRGDVNLGLLTPSLWERTVSSAQGPSHCRSQPTYISGTEAKLGLLLKPWRGPLVGGLSPAKSRMFTGPRSRAGRVAHSAQGTDTSPPP